MTPQRIIWHHSGINSLDPQFEKINLYHKTRKFHRSTLGFFVGYHYIIEPRGTVRQARNEDETGAHDQGENINSLGICLAGDFNVNLPLDMQISAATILLGQIRSRWNIPIARIEPHRWDDETDCPGTRLADNWLVSEFLKRSSDPLTRTYYALGTRLKLL